MDPFGDKQFQVMESYHYQPSDPCPPLPTSHWVVEGEPTTSSLGFMAKERRRGGKRGGGVKLSTDPQSVAARQRRHRISDRFKILKSLVPGGSKMDTVSMLEEAINYVKFLKAQIRLHQTALMFHPDDYSSLISFPTSAISASAAASAGGTAADSINTSCMLLPNEQVLLPSEQISSFTMEPWQQTISAFPSCYFHEEDEMLVRHGSLNY